jgi:hypothetical protein
MRRLLRRRFVLPALVLGVATALVGAWLYSRSESAALLVQQKLEERLGAVARFDRMSVGLSGTTVSGLKLYERDNGTDSEPFISVGEAEVDVAAVGAVLDRSPSLIRLNNAHVLLRFDSNGDLVTRLPKGNGTGGAIPTVRIESGQLTIRQEGRADSVFHGIDLTIAPGDQALTIAGTVEDEAWGKWNVEGAIPLTGSGTGRVTFETANPHHVTPDLLCQVPFVSPNAWTHVRLEGTTPARIDLKLDMATEHLAYRVALQPTRTTVDVPSIGLTFANANGQLVAEEGVVSLTDVRGSSADGEVRLDSRMDFAGKDDVLRFNTDLIKMDVQKLPRAWRLPPQIDGRLSGKVAFNVIIPDKGGTRVEAAGKATISDAKLQGRSVPPIELDVGTDSAGGLEFYEKPSVVEKRSPFKPLDPRAAIRKAIGRNPGLVSAVLQLAARIVKPANATPEEKAYLHLNVTFRDIDLAEALKTIGVEVPIRLDGKVTVQARLDIPTETPDEFKTYRLSGTLTSKRITVDELDFEELSAQVELRDGKLQVKDFIGRLPALGDAGGEFRARGELDVAKPYVFRASVNLDKLGLANANRLKNLLPLPIGLAGEANVEAKLDGTFSPLTLRTGGTARISKLRVGGVPAESLAFRWESDGEAIRFRDASAQLFGGQVTGEFDVPIREDVPGSGNARIVGLDLTELTKSMLSGTTLRLEGKADGAIKFKVPVAGMGVSRQSTTELELQAPVMKFQGIAARRLKGTGTFTAGVLKYNLTADALGGQIEVAGQYPPEKKSPPKLIEKKEPGLDLGRIKVRRIQLSGLWEILGLKKSFGPLDAEISGDFPLTTDDQGRLIGTGRLRAERIKWNDQEIAGSAQSVVRLTSKAMMFEEATLYVGEGVARLHATFNRADPDRSEATLTLTNVSSKRLLFLFPELAKRFEFPVDGRLSTTMGREWRGSGVLTSAKGKVYGVTVTDVRVPVQWVVHPDRGRGEIKVREAAASAAGGQMSARAEINLYNDLPPRLSGDVQFRNANLSEAFREAQAVGNLRVTGKLEFAAEQYRSADDLTAKLDAKLGESQPFVLPVFTALVPYLGLSTRDYNTTIREGEVRAVLGRGVWRVQRLTLTGPSLDLFADGTMTTSGRLNLSIAAASKQRPSQAVLRRFVPGTALTTSTTPLRPLGPVAMADAMGLIGSYVIYLEVTGTTDSPTVRVQVLRTLSEDAVRFFLFRFLTPLP